MPKSSPPRARKPSQLAPAAQRAASPRGCTSCFASQRDRDPAQNGVSTRLGRALVSPCRELAHRRQRIAGRLRGIFAHAPAREAKGLRHARRLGTAVARPRPRHETRQRRGFLTRTHARRERMGLRQAGEGEPAITGHGPRALLREAVHLELERWIRAVQGCFPSVANLSARARGWQSGQPRRLTVTWR